MHYGIKSDTVVHFFRRWEKGKRKHPHILDEHIECLASALGTVDALEQRAHLARLDRLQNLEYSLQMRILQIAQFMSAGPVLHH